MPCYIVLHNSIKCQKVHWKDQKKKKQDSIKRKSEEIRKEERRKKKGKVAKTSEHVCRLYVYIVRGTCRKYIYQRMKYWFDFV